MLFKSWFNSTAEPTAPVENVSAEVTSSTSVTVSWLPANRDDWNGIIVRYTIIIEQLGSLADSDTSNSAVVVFNQSLPTIAQLLANSPDPTLVELPLQREVAILNNLEEHHIYRFSVFYENSAGQSSTSETIMLETPATGELSWIQP